MIRIIKKMKRRERLGLMRLRNRLLCYAPKDFNKLPPFEQTKVLRIRKEQKSVGGDSRNVSALTMDAEEPQVANVDETPPASKKHVQFGQAANGGQKTDGRLKPTLAKTMDCNATWCTVATLDLVLTFTWSLPPVCTFATWRVSNAWWGVFTLETTVMKNCWHSLKSVSLVSSPSTTFFAVSNLGSVIPAMKFATFLVSATGSSKSINSVCHCWWIPINILVKGTVVNFPYPEYVAFLRVAYALALRVATAERFSA
jgi:hypothetical protein